MWVGRIIDPAGSQEDEAETENYKAHLYSEENVSPQKQGLETAGTTSNPNILSFNLATKFTMWSLSHQKPSAESAHGYKQHF